MRLGSRRNHYNSHNRFLDWMLKKSPLHPDKVLDTENAVCPVPVLMTREAMQGMKVGQILKIITRDTTAKTDIPVWARRLGNKVLKIEEDTDGLVLYLRRGVSEGVSESAEDIHLSTKRVKHLRLYLRESESRTVTSDVTLEAPAHIKVNNRDAVTILATPTHFEDLAVGYLLDENIIDDVDQISRLEVKGTDVIVETDVDVTGRIEGAENAQLITSECVSLEHYLRLSDKMSLPSVTSDYKVAAVDLSRMIKEFNLKQKEEGHPGGIHSAALFEEGVMKYYRLDVSRHSAVDKVLGASARDNVNFERSVVMTSGRQPAGMVLKAARMNIPISVSMRGPIYSGILAAQMTGVTLISYATANRLDIHSEADRVLLP